MDITFSQDNIIILDVEVTSLNGLSRSDLMEMDVTLSVQCGDNLLLMYKGATTYQPQEKSSTPVEN